MSKSQKKAHKNYEKKRIMKPISFNTETEKELLEFANSVDFSNWVKQKIKDEVSVQKTCI